MAAAKSSKINIANTRVIKKKGKGKAKKHPNKKESIKKYIGQGR